MSMGLGAAGSHAASPTTTTAKAIRAAPTQRRFVSISTSSRAGPTGPIIRGTPVRPSPYRGCALTPIGPCEAGAVPGPSLDALFVYGTLMPGHLRWSMLAPHATDQRPATVPGTLYDTGNGWPAAVFGLTPTLRH